MSFLNNLQKNLDEINNLQTTENGAIGYKTTGKKLLDMNFNIPKYRSATEYDINKDFDVAYSETPVYALLWTFFARDIRGGLGERRLFRTIFKHYCQLKGNAEVAKRLLPLVAEYGRWDDLVYCTVNTPVWSEAVSIIQKQLLSDTANLKSNKPISVIAKWLPSQRTSCEETKRMARKLAKDMGIPVKLYNKMLVALRKKLDVVEVKMSAREWKDINYATVPSYANLKYNNAFLRNDEERRRKYLASLEKGTTKINSSTAFPHDIVKKYNRSSYDAALEGMWKALPDMGGLDNTIVVSDGSGSMTMNAINGTRPLDVAYALSIYCSEHCNGEFKDKYITFSSRPEMVDLSACDSLAKKLKVARSHDDCSNTNIEAVFDIILDTAVSTNAKQEDIPATVLIISDMEFDMCVGSYSGRQTDWGWGFSSGFKRANSALFDVIKKRFEKAGYKMPRIVFWNVASRTGTIPMKENKLGVTLVSGYSVSIFQMVANGKTDPFENLVDTITAKRYQPVLKALQG